VNRRECRQTRPEAPFYRGIAPRRGTEMRGPNCGGRLQAHCLGAEGAWKQNPAMRTARLYFDALLCTMRFDAFESTMSSRNTAAAGWDDVPDPPKPVASWYTEGFCDGLGDRLLMFDNGGTPSLELLRFRGSFASAPGFEHALAERVDLLSGFEHRAFAQIRAVERLENGDLVLVSTFTNGKRLSEIFFAGRARAGVHPAFASWFIRESTGALAELHRQGDGIAHGALTPDRVILTADGRLVTVEHVLGSALDRLMMSVGRVQQLGIAALGNVSDRASVDQRSDVIQIGWIALSLLLGRRLTAVEYPGRVDALLEEFAGASPRGSTIVPALGQWLERALQVSGDAFESAVQAYEGLGELRIHGGEHAIAFAASRTAVEQLAFEEPRQLPPMPHPEEPQPQPSSPETSSETAMTMPAEFAALDARFDVPVPAAPKAQTVDAGAARRAKAGWVVAAALGAIAIGEAAFIAEREFTRPVLSPAAPVPVVIDSHTAGEPVIVDGRVAGVTPLSLAVAPGMHSIRLESRPVADAALTAPPPIVETPLEVPSAAVAATLAQAAARERRGGLRISAPIEVQVLEGERVLGSSSEGPVVATAGRHELDFVNSEFGYRARQTVEVKAGQIVPLKITPPDGRVSVNAVPWAQVSIDGNTVGETPLANLALPVGEHQITFRHPQLGERTQKVTVKSGALTRVSATLTR
jgi:hypothetical protein